MIVHLSGGRRGTTERQSGDTLRIGTSPEAEIWIPPQAGSPLAVHHATIHLRGSTHELEAEPGHAVWVNGSPVERQPLSSGDIVELGQGGPALRFRTYPADSRGHKSLREALLDCVDCARYEGATLPQRGAILLASAPRELATQTSYWLRGGLLAAVALVALGVAFLAVRTFHVEQELRRQHSRVQGIAALLEGSERKVLYGDDLERLRAELGSRLTEAVGRVETLEALAGAAKRVIADASRSVVFLQGAYGFLAADGRPLRVQVTMDGRTVTDGFGNALVTLEGEGPTVERLYTGTAFVAAEGGLLLTNRHVAVPWDYDEVAAVLMRQGLEPVMLRFIGYLPGAATPFGVLPVRASPTADVAVLRATTPLPGARPLSIREQPAESGDEVVVLGYPAGIRALLARTDEAFIDSLKSDDAIDFWEVARRLAVAGRIAPLATRGIVGQVTPAAIVYDAETTGGGSGGPVLTLDGEVVAVNAAILPEFGGSNLGVPAGEALKLVATARP